MNKHSYVVCSMVWRRKLEKESQRKPTKRNVLGETSSGDSGGGIDKSSFEAWWLMDVENDDYDAALQKKRVKARLDHVVKRADSMKSQMDRIEELVQKLR